MNAGTFGDDGAMVHLVTMVQWCNGAMVQKAKSNAGY